MKEYNSFWYIDTLWWIITGYCNLNCQHCYIESPTRKYHQLSTADCFTVISQAKTAGIKYIFITGGEPFIRNDVLEIFDNIYLNDMTIKGIETNATLIKSSAIKKITDKNIIWYISYDGVGCHEMLRGVFNIDNTIFNAINLLKEAGFKVMINTVVNQENYKSLIETYAKLKNLKIDAWCLFPPTNIGNWRLNQKDMLSTELEAKIYLNLLQKWLIDNKPFDLMCSSLLTQKREENGNILPQNFICEYFQTTVTLMPDGYLLPCCRCIAHPNIMRKMESIFNKEIKLQITNSYLKKLKNITVDQLLACNKACKSCELLNACLLGCRINAYLESGKLLTKEVRHCELMKKYYQYFHNYDFQKID